MPGISRIGAASAPAAPDVATRWRADHPEIVHAVWSPALGCHAGRLMAISVTPAARVLGLHAWDDAPEGVTDGTPWVIFDLEKALRMLLRQSPLALEVFAGASFGARLSDAKISWILENALTSGITRSLHDFAATALSTWTNDRSETNARDALRWRYAALASTRGEFGFDPAMLAEALERNLDADLDDVPGAIRQLDAQLAESKNVLSDAPRGYDALSDWLVETRLNPPT